MRSSPATGLHLRRAEKADCSTLAGLAKSAHSRPWNQAQYLQSLVAGHQCWLLATDARAIGFCVFNQSGDEAEILDMVISPGWRRRGLAEQLLSHLIAQLPRHTRRLLLEVRTSNLAAHSLYRKLGFSEDGLRKNYYPADNGGREDAVLMSLALHPNVKEAG
ncbi:ribosomal protein S18-alanine N-acetyltransferase [Microbulbifer spongiae]|uniref:Ribosomal protein S18-alanine N-acetyltransferase n=1 Tax=Microbulbifer spongiae TaxID=2944933 RepID=A0ABY9EA95_9GAMM|nr:ribosomal protein S18-alanine N-acetyltransferase [Microbulbifer sp. MI-G]WKD49247.1 ribosomal protein S18-alanine N-acetyltransferase [Microbulbifer sp. MI-G]